MNIIFLVQNDVTFNCLKKIYTCLHNNGVTVQYIAVPTWHDINNTPEGFQKPNTNSVKKLLEEQGCQYTDLELTPLEDRINFLKNIDPDCVIVATKDDHYMRAGFGIDCFEFTNIFKTIYIPYYGATVVDDEIIHTRGAGYKTYWKFFVDNITLENYLTNNGVDSKKIINLGHPKIEEIYSIRKIDGKWPLHNTGQTKIIWAPHWSCKEFAVATKNGQSWDNRLKFGTFLEYYNEFYNLLKNNQDKFQMVFRPHPLLAPWLSINNRINEYSDFLTKWNLLPNTSTELSGLYNLTFAASDLLITDGISFLTEYPIATGKPVIFIDSGCHAPFNEIGKKVELLLHKANSFNEIQQLLINYKNLDSKSIEAVLDYILPHREKTTIKIAQKIIELIQEEV